MGKFDTLEDIIVSDKVNHLNPAFYNFLSQMADSIADEIRNPLAGIAGTISIIKEEIKDHVDDKKLKTLDSCIQRIDSFVEDLYLLTRPINPSFIKVNYSTFVQQVVNQYFSNQTQMYTMQEPPAGVYIWADLILLQSAIVNVLDNAMDAIKKGGTINISFSLAQKDNAGNAVMTIHDSGCGIDKKNFEKLFTPFFTTKYNGRGLGLVIARNYIMLHKGQISIESKLNIGTKVSLMLPHLPGRE